MRALYPLTQAEQDLAEQEHQLVLDFLHCKRLPMGDFYDVVIFGYLSAVQQYIRNPPAGVCFKAMAFRAMKDSVLREHEYYRRPMRSGCTVGLDDMCNVIADQSTALELQVERQALLEQAAHIATPREAKIINLLLSGAAIFEAARILKVSKRTAMNCLEAFCCRARIAMNDIY